MTLVIQQDVVQLQVSVYRYSSVFFVFFFIRLFPTVDKGQEEIWAINNTISILPTASYNLCVLFRLQMTLLIYTCGG